MVERDAAAGLDLCLACHLRDDLRPGIPWQGDKDVLWKALGAIPYRADPFSMLGALALCLDNLEDGRFRELAAALVADLCGPTLDRGDGQDQLALFPALVDAADCALREVPKMDSRPVWWRDLCAWVQASLAARALLVVTFDTAEMASALRTRQTSALFPQSILDLRGSPRRMWGGHDVEGIRAEILGRLLLLKERSGAAGVTFPGAGTLERFEQESWDQGFWHRRFRPGPLEGHRDPGLHIRGLPRGVRREIGEILARRTPPAGSRSLHFVASLSLQVRLGARVGLRCAEIVRAAPLEDLATELGKELSLLALAAVQQGWQPLAEALMERCSASVDTQLTGQDMVALARAALVAVQALPAERALRSYGELLTIMAARASLHARRALRQELTLLRRVIPAEDWWLGQANALVSED